MEKKKILKRYRVEKLDDITVFIQNRHFSFSYTVADAILKDEVKGQYRYFGGLQCEFVEDSVDYKLLENWLCEIAEMILGIIKVKE